jgi:outer membrane protein assembly factor BamB
MRAILILFIVVAVLAGASGVAQVGARPDWPQWRGPQRSGVATLAAPATWPAALTKRWEAVVGVGHSSPIIAGDRVVIHTRESNQEIVRALDLQTGKEQWRNQYAAPYTVHPAARGHGPGPKSTPTAAGGRVFTFGIGGILSAFDLASGTLLWRQLAPTAPPEFGTAMSPIVDGQHVIVHLGAFDKGVLTAFEAATGAVRWRWTGDGPGYASPVIAEIGGTRQLVTQSENAVIAVDAANGQLLWQIPFKTAHDQNSVTPVVVRDLVIYSGLDNGTLAARIARKGSSWGAEPAWKNDQVSMYMNTAVVSGSAIYGLSHRNRGQFFALDVSSGKTLWMTPGREGDNASLILAEPMLLISTTNAELIVARANPTRFEEVKRYTVADSAVWAHPAVSRSLIVVKDVDKVICWEIGKN